MRKWRSARAATCGAWVTAITWTRSAQPRQPLADGVGDRAADAGVDLVEDQRRGRAAVGEHHLQRQHEAGELAAGGDLHQRPGPGARVGLRPRTRRARSPPGRGRSSSVSIRRDEAGALEPQEAAAPPAPASSSTAGGGPSPGRQRPGGGDVDRVGLGRPGALQRGKLLLACVDRGDIGLEALAQGREVVGGHVVLARRGPEREQALLGPLQLARIVLGGAQRLLQGRAGLVEGDERAVERPDAPVHQRRRLRAAALQLAQRAGEGRDGGARADDDLVGVAEILRHLLGRHHDEASLGERRFLARLAGRAREAPRRRGGDSPPLVAPPRSGRDDGSARPCPREARAPPPRPRRAPPRGRRRRRGWRDGSPDRRGRGRRAARGSRRPPSRWRAEPGRRPAGR